MDLVEAHREHLIKTSARAVAEVERAERARVEAERKQKAVVSGAPPLRVWKALT